MENDNSVFFIPVVGEATIKKGGEKINIKEASIDGEWYVDDRDRLYSQQKLKYIKIALDSE